MPRAAIAALGVFLGGLCSRGARLLPRLLRETTRTATGAGETTTRTRS
jgi:hypothetical protein